MIAEQQSIIVKTLCRLLVPFIQMFGLYVIMHGHSSPGGGFQGGVILASSFILLALADGHTVAATYFGDVVRLDDAGDTRWLRNVSPLCYPQQAYEPIFRPDR